MIGLSVNQAKTRFFDRLIHTSVDKATMKNLSKFGAFVRRTAKGLIRKVGKKGTPSKPGQPPKSRTGILKEFIFFAFDPAARSVVVGPAKTNQVFFNGAGKPVKGTVPAVLEFGGSIGVLEWYLEGRKKWVRADLRFKRKLAERKTRIRTVKVAARPYMQPAFKKEAPKFASIWADTVRAAA